MHMALVRAVFVLACCAVLSNAVQAAVSPEDFQTLKQEVEALRAKGKAAPTTGTIGRADVLTGEKYGPDAVVKTKEGRLQIGGLLQVWNYRIQNDNINYNAPFKDPNEFNDNDSYRIRRAELRFTMKITEDITAHVRLDTTGGDAANGFPNFPSNQGTAGNVWYTGLPGATLTQINAPGHTNPFTNSTIAGVVAAQNMQNGTQDPNHVLQDAYIVYKSALTPHHDFTVGQFKPAEGEEGIRDSGLLDFGERAMITQFSAQPDLGIQMHGTWFNDRFQYWVGGFDGAGTFQNTIGTLQNRTDDNDEKDLVLRVTGRPVWDVEKWYGRLEVGYSRRDGVHGEAGTGFIFTNAGSIVGPSVDGLSLEKVWANRQYAFAWYRPGSVARGWWLRGEWSSMTDRAKPGFAEFTQPELNPHAFRREGWEFSTGYKLSESIWSDHLKDSKFFLWKMLHDVEFAYRYETFGNLVEEDLTSFDPVTGAPNRADVFKTSVHTAGINYYWKGYNVRTQINYMWVNEPNGNARSITYPLNTPPTFIDRRVREVKNNVFLISQQVMW